MQTENTYVETNLGNIALNPRGEYSDEVSYEYLDTVSYEGGSYICVAELGKSISGIAPAQGKNTEHWQMLTLPGQLTPEAVAMHDDVVNKAKQVETSRAAVELSQQEVEAAQADVNQMRQDTQKAAEEAASSRDSAAGYAQSAETSRTAAKESEDNINAQVTGFDTHVAEKTSAAESAIIEARQTAVNTVSAKQGDAVQAVTGEGNKQIKNVEDAGTEQVGKVKSAGASAVSTAGAAGVSAVNAVKTQQTASIKVVADKGTQQVTAVNTAGSTQVSTIETKGADQVKAIKEAGENALQNISNSVDKGLSEEGKAADAKATGEAISNLTKDMTSKADKTSLAQTNRKLDALWKLNQGISYKFEEDDEEAYQKAIPTGAKLGSVKSVAGKTIVWNWLSDVTIKTGSDNGIDYVSDGKNISLNGSATSYTEIIISETALPVPILKGHKYYISTGLTKSMSGLSVVLGGTNMSVGTQTKEIKTCATGATNLRFLICVQIGPTLNNTVITPKLVDLTKMFGAGKEPSTPEEFEAMFPEDYYEYNEGTLMSMPVDEVIEQGRNLFSCYGFSAESIITKDAPRKISNSYGTTLSTIDYADSIVVTQEKINNTDIVSNYTNGYFNIGINDLEYKKEYILSFDFTPTKMLIANVTELNILVNGLQMFVTKNNFVLNKKSRITVKFTFVKTGEKQYIEIRNAGMSGLFENFQIEENKVATTYSLYHRNKYQIPQEILDLPGYGWSAGDVCNEVNWENKQYIQRAGSVDLGSLDFTKRTFVSGRTFYSLQFKEAKHPVSSVEKSVGISSKYDVILQNDMASDTTSNLYWMLSLDGELRIIDDNQPSGVLYYELAKPIVTDISDLISDDFLTNLEVESGGTLTFKNTNVDGYRIPVKSSEEYVVKLSEIAGGTE